MAPARQQQGHNLTYLEQAHVLKDQLLKKVDAQMEKHPQFTQRAFFLDMEKKLNMPAPALFIGATSLIVLVLVLVLSVEGLALLTGFAYPVLGSLRAMKVEEPQVMKFFIKYFLLYNLINLLDTYLPLAYIPFYALFKLFFLLWCFSPKTQGANVVYLLLRPFLLPALGIEPAAATAEPSGQAALGGGKGKISKEDKKAAVAAETAAAATAVTLCVKLAARGLERPPEPERLDTLCQLRVLPPTTGRKAALDEGQWYKTPTNTLQPEDSPDWTHDPQRFTLPTLEDNVLEVLVINKMSWKDQPLGKVRLPLKGLVLPVDTTLPLEDPNDEGNPVQGELIVELSLVE